MTRLRALLRRIVPTVNTTPRVAAAALLLRVDAMQLMTSASFACWYKQHIYSSACAAPRAVSRTELSRRHVPAAASSPPVAFQAAAARLVFGGKNREREVDKGKWKGGRGATVPVQVTR